MTFTFFKKTLLAVAAVTTFAAPSFATEASTNWRINLHQQLSNKNVYPRAALNNDMEGQVKLRVKILQDGSIQKAEILEASGHSILDKSALRSILALNELPALPEGQKSVSVIIPITYQINNQKDSKHTVYANVSR